VLQVLQKATPNHTFDLLAGNSSELEVDELPEVTKSKLDIFFGKLAVSLVKFYFCLKFNI
jgi:hypothetical protein